MGDNVNIAARLEAIAEPGGICLSAAAYEQVRGKLDIAVADIGEPELKNIARPVRAYRVLLLAMDPRPFIAVVEDEAVQRELLVDYLARQNFRVAALADGAALRRLVAKELPAFVMLDVGLPGEDGFALARWLREKSGRVGVIMVTAAADTVDRVVGLESGADDYIAKPFEPRELLARVKSVLRRAAGMPAEGPRVRIGRRVLDLERRVLIDPANDSEEGLAASEFDPLKISAENPNRPLMRSWLLEVTAHRGAEAFDRAIDLRITRLRRKVERPTRPTPRRSGRCAAQATCSSRQKTDRLAQP